MPKMKVRAAMVRYRTGKVGRELAFRGQTIEISADEVDRINTRSTTPALVPADQDLDRAGTMRDLPEAPSDAEIVAWVMDASDVEVAALAHTRPDLAVRIADAAAYTARRRDEELERLGQATGVVTDANPDLETQAAAAAGTENVDPGTGGQGRAGQVAGPGPLPEGEAPTTQPAETDGPPVPGEDGIPSPGDIVQSDNYRDIVEYVAAHPELAQQVLEAEKTFRASQSKDPRDSVVKAVASAVALTQ